VTVLDLDRLKRAGLAQGKAIPDTMFRVNLVRDRFEEAISAFESTCAAEGIKYQVKQEEKEISFDLLKIVTFQRSEDKAQQLLYDASEYCRAHGFHVEHESNPGSPKDFLLPIATYWQADMIVLGNSARNLMVKRLIGETALHIIRNADRPLFLCQ
jgi:nucleotide-binding universal stress UspA family protein